MSNLYFRNPRLLALTLALIVVAGLSAYQALPRAEDPELAPRFASVLTRFPGASAERVEALVTEKLEQELREVDELKRVESTSRTGISVLQLEIRDEIDDVEPVWSRVRDHLDDVAPLLPAGVLSSELEEFDVRAFSLVAGLAWRGAGPPPQAVLGRLAEDLADRLRAVPGTEEAEVFGAVDEEILVEIDGARLASLGMTPADVAARIGASDAKLPAGSVRGRESDLLLEVSGELDSLARIGSIPLVYGQSGEVVRVADVARVEKTAREPASDLALLDGRPGVAVGALLRSGSRVDRWSSAARVALDEFALGLSPDLALETLFDQSRYTEERLDGLFANLALSALLVMGVILLAMGWRSALLVGTALPLSILMVLAAMQALSMPLHQMSVAGLVLALGMLIDNAIIIVDEVRQRLDAGLAPAQAISAAVRTLFMPLFGSTLTTVLAFLPLVLMPGGAGEFVGSIGISVSLALASSLFLALTVVPALVGLVERASRRFDARGPRWLESGLSSTRLTALYRRALDLAQARPVHAIAFFALLPLVGFGLGTRLEEQFFPPAERDQFQVELRLPDQASLAATRALALSVGERLRRHEEVAAVHFFVGAGAPRFYYNLLETEEAPYYAQALVQLGSREGARDVLRRIQNDLDGAFPAAQVLVRQLEQGPPFDAPVELHLSGPDLDRLRLLGEEARAALAVVPGVLHTRATLIDGRPQVAVRVDEVEANRAGMANADVARRLSSTLEGALGGSLVEATEELPVRVRVAGDARADVERLASFELEMDGGGADAAWTPLSALASVELVPELASIPHRDGVRTNTIQGFLVAGTLPSAVLAGFEQRLASAGFELPPGYSAALGGESFERDQAVGNLLGSAGVLFILIAATLVLSFQSFRMAAIVALVGLLSLGLALGSLWLFDLPFGFMAIVGAMGLVGVAINDTIVVLAALREDPRARLGDPAAVREVVVRATRHVLSTTVTTVAGFLPLILAGGAFWPPLAVTIASGVTGATVLALGLVPAIYGLVTRWRAPREHAQELVPAPALG